MVYLCNLINVYEYYDCMNPNIMYYRYVCIVISHTKK